MVNLGLPSFVIVEPTGRAIQEARERIIRASVRNAGFEFLPAAGDGESTGSM
jgi:predicted ATPase with chaperone activity